jgi:hypothetical protein
MNSRCRKLITRVIVFLLLGAIVNVAVALTSAWRGPPLKYEEYWNASVAAGFPMPSLCGKIESGESAGLFAVSDRYGAVSHLPCFPIWPGFAINTIFYAAILWLLFFAPGSLRRMIRRRRGLCPACAYPVGTSPVCTECGQRLE